MSMKDLHGHGVRPEKTVSEDGETMVHLKGDIHADTPGEAYIGLLKSINEVEPLEVQDWQNILRFCINSLVGLLRESGMSSGMIAINMDGGPEDDMIISGDEMEEGGVPEAN